MKLKILFVCTQNVFRSLSAHKLLEFYDKENKFEVDSAGTIASSWETPYIWTLNTLYEIGVEKFEHKNKKITTQLLKEQDIIIAMTKQHQQIIRNLGFESYLFNQIVYNQNTDLMDDNETTYHSLEEFVRETVEYINQSTPILIEKLKEINNN